MYYIIYARDLARDLVTRVNFGQSNALLRSDIISVLCDFNNGNGEDS